MKTIRPYFKDFLLGLKMCENRSREFLDTVGGLEGLFLRSFILFTFFCANQKFGQ